MRTTYGRTLALFATMLAGVVSVSVQAANAKTKAAFLKDCAVVAPAISPHFNDLCKGLSDEKTSAQLADYDQALKEIAEDLKKWGPDVAKHVIAKCAAAATDKTGSPLDLQFCLETKSLNVQDLAKGSANTPDDPHKVASLVAKGQATNSPGGPGWNSLSDDQKKQIRRAAVDACAAEGPPYLAAACAAVAVHEEVLAGNPYGDGGEIAKQFDTLMHGFTAAGGAQQKANDFAQQALQGIGVPVPNPSDVNGAAAKALGQATQTLQQTHDAAKNEFEKRTGIKLPSWP